jgi:hypothetical protein
VGEDFLSSLVGALVLVVVMLAVALVVLRRRDDPAEVRRDLERREQRVAERESRLDTEARHLEDRARELGDQHDVLARNAGRARRPGARSAGSCSSRPPA